MSTEGDENRKEIRCFCARHPMLAMYGVDDSGRLYIHIKIYRQNRLFGEYIVRGGDIEMRCRECLRWYRIFIRDNRPVLRQEQQPEELKFDQHSLVEFSDIGG